jgi:predicted DCC family thiol-disulfide oxidoreductase YuxK
MLYDGECGLCDRSVQWILRHDPDGLFRFAPLQGETAARLRGLHPEIPDELSTVVLVERGRVHLRSRAFMVAARHFPYPWKVLSWLRVVPAVLADVLYRLIARLRYRIWGKVDACRVPSPAERERFLP